MNFFRLKIVLAFIALTIVIGIGGYAGSRLLDDAPGQEEGRPFYLTSVKGLTPGSAIQYKIAYSEAFRDHYPDQNLKKYMTGTVDIGADGTALLPEMRDYYESYDLFFGPENNRASLHITKNENTGRFNIQGKGFETFSDVFIQDKGRNETVKTDWAGLFSDTIFASRSKDQGGETVKLAFQGFTLDGMQNPSMLEVVIGLGGGPTSFMVDIYDPVIHFYNCSRPTSSTDGDSVFYVSTCDQARMQSHVEGTGPGTIIFNLVQPMLAMTSQLSAVMMQQMEIIGSFLDAKEQMEAQRDIERLRAEANKDYQPSEQMCRFGSYVRSISETEERGEYNKQALDKVLIDYYNYQENMSSSEGYGTETVSRLARFKSVYCDPNDNNGSLWEMCRGVSNDTTTNPSPSGTPAQRNRYNKDIDYFSTFYRPLTLDVDYLDDQFTEKEEDIIALAKNLYWPKVENLPAADKYNDAFEKSYRLFFSTRSLTSKYNVAHNSFATIVGMKSRSDDTIPDASAPASLTGQAYMKALLQNDFNLTNAEIDEMLGDNPSYYAQMDFLTKKLYQNPNFYTALYDKPANVDRINATLESFKLMHGRDRFESLLRQEMLTSMLVEEALAKHVAEVNVRILSLSNAPKPLNPTGAP
ncbi:MAG: hypothetical protein CMH27_09635 [Micavibrio sp.]|nr:hypothetical protein [Micavibrio sp.]